MNNLALREHSTPSESEFQIMLQQSTMLIKSGFLPQAIKSPEQALAIMLTGRELGIPTMAALNTINVIQGKPTISPQLMLALIERSGQLEDIKIDTGKESVSCTMKRKGRSPHTEVFGKAEATALNLIGKDNYKKQPLIMYRWRVVASCARVVFPDVILGLYTPDEMGAEVSEDGEILKPELSPVREFPKQIQEAEKIEAEPVSEREAKVIAVRELCAELNKAGDDIQWKPAALKEYINNLFEVTDGIDALSFESFDILIGDLEGRLKILQTAKGE